MRVLQYVGLLGLLLLGAAGAAHSADADSNLIFEDNFDGDALDLDTWDYHNSGVRFDAINTRQAVGVDDGHLRISTFKNNANVLTGSISSQTSVAIQTGFLETRVKFPSVEQGKVCSIWAQSAKFGNASIDPELKPENTGSFVTLIRYAPNWNGVVTSDVTWGNWGDKKQSQRSKTPVPLDDGEFHVFGLEMLEDRYRFYLNGKPYWEITEGISGVPLYLVITCEVKSALGEFTGSKPENAFEIDYVKIYDSYPVENKEPRGTPITQADWDIQQKNGNLTFGDFRDDPQFKPSQPDDYDAMRVLLEEGTHLGTDAVFELPDNTREAWVEYCMLFSSSWKASVAGKLPGFAGKSGRWWGGQGGKPSNGKNAWSARMLYGEFEQQSMTVPLGQYIYHTDQGKVNKYGDPDWWTLEDKRPVSSSARATIDQWVSVKQHIKVNTKGENDGVINGWVDGELVYSRNDLNFSNSKRHRVVAKFWLDVYFGGGETAKSDQVLFFDQFNYSLDGDTTSSNCPYIPPEMLSDNH